MADGGAGAERGDEKDLPARLLDGRDTPAQCGKNAGDIRSQICRSGKGRIARFIGRYYADGPDNG
ncbi:hypothetical protein LAD77_00400 [Klebsiella pneumoniae]|nr:hypothetical protein [Klebsiella pneumoniae]